MHTAECRLCMDHCTKCTGLKTILAIGHSFLPCYRGYITPLRVFNRPVVAWAVLQSPPLLINSLIEWSFSSESLKHCLSQPVRAGELKFWENVHPPTICQVSGVRCQVSGVTGHVLSVTCHMSLTPTAAAVDPPTAKSPTIHSRMVCKDLKIILFFFDFRPFPS